MLQLAFMGFWLFFVIICVMWYLPRKAIFYIANNYASVVLIKIVGGKVVHTGTEHIDKNKNYMYLCNHSSWLDILVIMSTSGQMVHFIAKKELGKLPLLGFIMKRMGMIFVDRGNTRKSAMTVKETLDRLKGGTNIAAFPEGTRSKNGRISIFKKGLFQIAIIAGIDIIPVGIVNAHKLWPINNSKFRPGTVEIHYGEPIDISKYTESNINELMTRVKSEITRLSKQS